MPVEVAEHLESGALISLLPDYTVVPEWSIYAICPPTPSPPTRVEAFIEFISKMFDGVPALAR